MENLNNKKILVTGGAGFIGSHLVDKLVKLCAKVTVIDNLQAGKKENLKQSWSKINFNKGDIRDENLIKKVVKGQDLIFHIAANASVPYSVENPEYDFQTNVVGTYNLLKYAVKYNIEKFIYASSAGVYGEPVYVPMDEKHPTNPISPYGATKLAGEKMGLAYHHTYDLNFISLRIFNTYGPRQGRYVLYDFLLKLNKNRNYLEILGEGEQQRDFSYIADTVRAFILVAIKNTSHRIYNVSGGRSITIKELAFILLDILNFKNTKIIFTKKSWVGDIAILVGNISRIKQIGFKPETILEDGIKKTIAEFKKDGLIKIR